MENASPTLYRWVPHLCIGLVMVYLAIWLTKPVPFFADGVDWTQYISGAEYIWHPGVNTIYPTWRKPLYPFLLGLCSGESYAHAARGLNALGVLMMCGAAIRISHVRKIPWFTVWCVLLMAVHPLLVDARDWINPYPLWGGAVALMLSFASTTTATSRWWHWTTLSVLSAFSMALDGRTLVVLLPMLVWLSTQSMRRTVLLPLVLVAASLLEQAFMVRFNITTLSLWDMLIEQRTYLFRDGMVHQLFPETFRNGHLASVCQGTNPEVYLRADFLSCAGTMLVTNVVAWFAWGLMPHVLCVVVMSVLVVWRHKQMGSDGSVKWVALCVALMIGGQFLLSLLVWQPPRYLFLTFWLILAVVAWCVEVLRQWNGWTVLPSMFVLLWWFVQAPALNSQDRPKDWNTTGRLLSEQVGIKVLNCTPRPYALTTLSSYRSSDWQMEMDPKECNLWMANGTARDLGIDTVLTESRFEAPSGWVLETGFDFRSGVLWMYRHQEK